MCEGPLRPACDTPPRQAPRTRQVMWPPVVYSYILENVRMCNRFKAKAREQQGRKCVGGAPGDQNRRLSSIVVAVHSDARAAIHFRRAPRGDGSGILTVAPGMNYLAHLYLTDDSPYGLVGSLLPDMVRGRADDQAHPLVMAAVRTHRRVDVFADTHPIFARSRERIGLAHRLLAGVIVDMIYDHFLATDWSQYSDVPLDDFVTYVHDVLRKHTYLMPDQMQSRIGRMIEQGWIRTYATVGGLNDRSAQMSAGISQRLGRTVRMQDAIADLEEEWSAFSADFHEFFPHIIEHVRGKAADRVSV